MDRIRYLSIASTLSVAYLLTLFAGPTKFTGAPYLAPEPLEELGQLGND